MENISPINPLTPGVNPLESMNINPAMPEEMLSFKKVFKDTISDVNGLNTQAKTMVEALATGQTNDVSGVMLSVRKANMAFLSLLQVRNQMIEAYQEIMRMRM